MNNENKRIDTFYRGMGKWIILLDDISESDHIGEDIDNENEIVLY